MTLIDDSGAGEGASMSCDDGDLLYAIGYAYQAGLIARALYPPDGTSGRERAVFFLVGFTQIDDDAAAALLDRIEDATDAVLQCPDYRQALCLSLIDRIAAPHYTVQ